MQTDWCWDGRSRSYLTHLAVMIILSVSSIDPEWAIRREPNRACFFRRSRSIESCKQSACSINLSIDLVILAGGKVTDTSHWQTLATRLVLIHLTLSVYVIYNTNNIYSSDGLSKPATSTISTITSLTHRRLVCSTSFLFFPVLQGHTCVYVHKKCQRTSNWLENSP